MSAMHDGAVSRVDGDFVRSRCLDASARANLASLRLPAVATAAALRNKVGNAANTMAHQGTRLARRRGGPPRRSSQQRRGASTRTCARPGDTARRCRTALTFNCHCHSLSATAWGPSRMLQRCAVIPKGSLLGCYKLCPPLRRRPASHTSTTWAPAKSRPRRRRLAASCRACLLAQANELAGDRHRH